MRGSDTTVCTTLWWRGISEGGEAASLGRIAQNGPLGGSKAGGNANGLNLGALFEPYLLHGLGRW